jgi:hypothetical protein
MRGDRARGSQHACLLVAASREAKQRKMKEGRQSKIFMRQCIYFRKENVAIVCNTVLAQLPGILFGDCLLLFIGVTR